ncbi:unnamed protein product [Rotaria magnacalcarata]|uniref:Arrestin C-terminal-like domain-containing protein n=1 Tax=Rotaria magnacalcarata TaxID=392030 RepID=A0A815HPT5_9BILA|nr:unnamed protein product [Rotaria magnacalcarata]CAF1628114.1 unnamed protein product [Rotaria magnacalcarata]CAF2170815.1 unnamed protein product [Rotaria magnacalcarata]CAF3749980.1 unnamed protein product [Rotaria magnacalcarata]CAF3751905.1 unnamed protein product [Rotaria magnacalcarata]
MGSNNSVHITISLDQSNRFFYAGERISGAVHLNINEEPVELKEIFILLNGETGYTTTRTVWDSNGSTSTETDYHTVFPNVSISNNPQCSMRPVFSNHHHKKMHLKVFIDRSSYAPGETVTGTLEIENSKRVLLKKIYLSLIQQYRIECNSGQMRIARTIIHTRQEHIVEKISFDIPFMHLPPSYEFHGGFIQATHMDVHYILEFKVKPEGIFTSFKTGLHITLMTDSNGNPTQNESYCVAKSPSNSISSYSENKNA